MSQSPRSLEGRVALVTGAASGLGRATALELAGAGARVVVADIDLDGALRTVELVEDDGGAAEAVALDVTDPVAVDRLVAMLSTTHGHRFDCLVNNAGTDRGADLVDIVDEEWHRVFAVNVHGPMYLSRAFVRHLLAQAADGGLEPADDSRPADPSPPADLVCVVSISALTVGAGAGAYNASKAALLKLTEVLQTEARERAWPVRVTAVNPAAMATPMMDQWGLPAERMMDPAIVAGLVRTAVTLPAEVVLHHFVVTMRNEYYPR